MEETATKLENQTGGKSTNNQVRITELGQESVTNDFVSEKEKHEGGTGKWCKSVKWLVVHRVEDTKTKLDNRTWGGGHKY